MTKLDEQLLIFTEQFTLRECKGQLLCTHSPEMLEIIDWLKIELDKNSKVKIKLLYAQAQAILFLFDFQKLNIVVVCMCFGSLTLLQ